MKSQFIFSLVFGFVASTPVLWDKLENFGFGEEIPEDAFNINQPDVRIIGGQLATKGQFPYQAALRITRESGASLCGGVLISKDYVLTAGHCAIKAIFIIVTLGALKFRDESEDGRQDIRVESDLITVHENYNEAAISDDIAILKFPQSIQFTSAIQSISLPTRSDANRNLEDVDVIPSGWGRTANNGAVSDELMYAKVKLMAPAVCRHFFRASLRDSNICTNTNYFSGICNGDSGGPVALTEPDGNKKVLGLSSFVSSYGCVRGFPSVFVRVTSYLDWIAQHSDIKIFD